MDFRRISTSICSLIVFLLVGAIGPATTEQGSFGWISHASAQARVAVLPFSGSGADSVRRDVIDILRDNPRLRILDEQDAAQAARTHRVIEMDAGGVSELATELSAALVVQGQVGGTRSRRSLTVVFRDAQGLELASNVVPLRGRRLRAAIQAGLDPLVEAAIAQLSPEALQGNQAPTSGSPNGQPSGQPNQQTNATPNSGQPTEAPVEIGPGAPPPGRRVGGPLLTIYAGLNLRTREASFATSDNTARVNLASGLFPELTFGFELRPLAGDVTGLARGLYIDGSFGISLGISIPERSTGTSRSATYMNIGANLGWLIPLVGDDFMIAPFVGFLFDSFSLQGNETLPSAAYMAIRPGLRFRIRALREVVVIEAIGAFRGVFASGGLSQEFGSNGKFFGRPNTIGLDFGGSLNGTLDFGMHYALVYTWSQYMHSFSAASMDAGGIGVSGTDGGHRVGVHVGYSFF